MLLWGLWRGEDAPKNTAKLRRAASGTKRNDINEQLAPLCTTTTTITKAVWSRGRETEDDVLVHFLFVLWLFFFSVFFLFSFALCVLCVIFSLLLIKCTTSVINFASSGNCSVCYVWACVCASYATTALATTITITTTTPRGVERDVSPNHSWREEQCDGWGEREKSKRNESKSKSKSNTINTKIALHNGG